MVMWRGDDVADPGMVVVRTFSGGLVRGNQACRTPLRRRLLSAILAVLLLVLAVPDRAVWAQLTPTPSASGYRGTGQENPYTGDFSDLALAIDGFWSTTFQDAGAAYLPPAIVPLDHALQSACGLLRPGELALYCGLDATIYLSPAFLAEQHREVGDYAPITVLAHEWGHHIQFLTKTPNPGGNTFELQADCLAGVYTADAEKHGVLDPGDISEAVTISKNFGDALGLPQDAPGAHGINDDRITAFMRGYLNGLADCDLQLRAGPSPPSRPLPPAPIPQAPATLSLPSALPLAHASCFRIENDHTLSFEELTANLGGTNEARGLLQTWGWQASANRAFACDNPPDGEAGWIDVSLHLFGDAQSAQQAVDYFAAARQQGTRLITADPPAIGDHAAVLTGPASNGKEFTLYVSRGPLLIRVTGVSPTGIPFINVLTVAQAILAAPLPQAQPDVPTPVPPEIPMPSPSEVPSAPDGAVDGYLPSSLPLGHAACFRAGEILVLDFPGIVARFPSDPNAAERLEALGWQTAAYRQFTCANPPAGSVNWIDISVHRFGDPASAAEAVSFFSQERASGTRLAPEPAMNLGNRSAALAGPSDVGTEYTLYVSFNSLLLRITGVAPSGDPAPEVEQVMLQVLAGIPGGGEGPGIPTAVATTPPSLPPTPIPTPTIVPTATPLPTATPAPTITPMPTATPVPAATPRPTVTPTPTPIPPSSVTTAAAIPTATPRISRPLPGATANPVPATLPTAAPQPTAKRPATATPPTVTAAPRPTRTPVPAQSLEPTTGPPSGAETEAERIQRINGELISYGEWVAGRYQRADSPSGSLRESVDWSSYLIAQMGVLGDDGGSDIYSGPASGADAMALAHEWLDSMPSGTFPDPESIHHDVFRRLVHTDMGTLTPQEQIAITNGALFTIDPYMTEEFMRWFMESRERAGRDYLLALASGETTWSYPQYLQERGFDDPF